MPLYTSCSTLTNQPPCAWFMSDPKYFLIFVHTSASGSCSVCTHLCTSLDPTGSYRQCPAPPLYTPGSCCIYFDTWFIHCFHKRAMSHITDEMLRVGQKNNILKYF